MLDCYSDDDASIVDAHESRFNVLGHMNRMRAYGVRLATVVSGLTGGISVPACCG